jgi:hypothetical protein
VHTTLNGVNISVDEETGYPFRDSIDFTIHVSRSAFFPLVLRIPGWANGANLSLNGKTSALPVSGCSSEFAGQTTSSSCHPENGLHSIKRVWKDGDRLTLSLAATPRVTHWYHDSAVFERGPLVFSLPLDGEWTQLKKYSEQSADWQVTPTANWNYAVELGSCDAKSIDLPIGDIPFDRSHPPVALIIRGRQDPQWTTNENSAGPVPLSPISSSERLETLKLIPYGAAKLRITAFPYLAEKSVCGQAGAVNKRQMARRQFSQ